MSRENHPKTRNVGEIILLVPRAGRNRDAEAMSYGRDNEPSPDLLLRRGRATMFATVAEAEAALIKTFQAAEKSGDKWPAKFAFKIITVEKND